MADQEPYRGCDQGKNSKVCQDKPYRRHEPLQNTTVKDLASECRLIGATVQLGGRLYLLDRVNFRIVASRSGSGSGSCSGSGSGSSGSCPGSS